MATFSRQGTDNRYVVMDHGNLQVKFDTWFGGAPLTWTYNGSNIIYTHAGEGFQNTVEEGQDLTQASSNGETVFRIARQNDSPAEVAYRNYYGRESLPSGWPSGATYYKLTGFYPDFWLSHEAPDDSLPPMSSGQDQNGWILRWRYPNHELPEPYRSLPFPQRGGAPVFFQATAEQTSGILMEGNQMIVPGAAVWNERLREIPNGRVAFRCRISFSEASADSWAGVMFRRSVPGGSGKNMDDAFNAAGYSLNINRQGAIQIIRQDGTLAWDGGINATVQQAANTVEGCLVELRTFNGTPARVEIWVEKGKVATVDLPGTVYTGPHFGLIAYTAYDPNNLQYVKFSDRDVFNVGTDTETVYTPLSDGSVEVNLFVGPAGGVTEVRKLYRVNTVAFLAEGNGLDTVWTEKSQGVYLDSPSQSEQFLRPILNANSQEPAYALWSGKGDGSLGMYCVPLEVTLQNSNVSSPGEHGLTGVGSLNVTGHNILHLNALPVHTSGNPPWTVGTARLKAKWFPETPY